MTKLIIKTYKDRYGRNRRDIQFKNKAMYHLGFTLRKAHGRGWFINRYNQQAFFAYTLKDIDFFLSKDHDISVIAELMMFYYKNKGKYNDTKIEIDKQDLIMDFEELAMSMNALINKETT
tara:strand:+ start:6635 stop:6994 length:360 start_codon:yes stop_codon:yes gene_type:complete